MKILLTGKNGQLGRAFLRQFDLYADMETFATDIEDLDITDLDELKRAFVEVEPDFVVNCAAYTAVDDCETKRELALKVNAQAPADIAELCRENGVKLVHFSTDYVFDGAKEAGYSEDDEVSPISFYGESKLRGEANIMKNMDDYYIVRTSLLFGDGANFVKTMIDLARDRHEMHIVDAFLCSPTYAEDLAKGVVDMILRADAAPGFGIYHLTNDGACTRYEFAKKAFEFAGLDLKVKPVDADYFPQIAARPKYSTLLNNKLPHLRGWEAALKEYVTNLS